MMDGGEDLDREVIIERAEALRAWLAGFGLSGRTSAALERELQGIISNDPGGYINGRRPLAGYTSAEFVASLHERNGGAVGQVKSVGDAVLKELRATIPPDAATPAPEPSAAPEASAQADAVPAPRRRGRPKGSTSARKSASAPAPRAVEHASVPPPSAAAAPSAMGSDIALGQLVRLWPGLHPQARRAVVLYASELLAEAVTSG